MNDAINIHTIGIPDDVLDGWQQSVDLIASICEIPTSLIMRVHAKDIEVFASSQHDYNPYHCGHKEELGQGLYCETVIKQQAELLVANALVDPIWDHNPDIKIGMISYCGLPLNWPTGEAFGTICILDNKANQYNEQKRQLLYRFQKSVEASLTILYQTFKLQYANEYLEQRVHQRTNELETLYHRLSQEIDERNSAEKIIYQQKHYDILTGLPNRKLLKEKFKALENASLTPLSAAVLHVGINNMKVINDNFGYMAGDNVIHTIARQLKQHIPATAFLAHLSGDQFIILYTAQEHSIAEESAQLANKLCQLFSFSRPVVTEEQAIPLSVSIGIALYPDDALDMDELLRKSSAARISKQATADNQYQFFNLSMLSQISTRLQIESQLSNALKNKELTLHYQPLICTQSRKIIGAEALLRWNNSMLGSVPPDSFIPIAEQSGLILSIGNFVLRSAIKQTAHWCKTHQVEVYVAVNISPIQFRDNQLATHILELLEFYELPPHCLEVEITEGVLLQDEAQALEILNVLAESGVRISLDDFGTGYSSLSYLQKFPFDTVKIDRSFISSLAESSRNQDLVTAIISMARNLKLHVVAEGIETIEQSNFITQAQCEIGQGYLYGKPDLPEVFLQQILRQTKH
ncbi:bifunctional diguanylate cyclase/phosphodiesterase [Neptunomonas japonica]|uniref:bifunctional diguanylate cyclase/phosphodiesterase n=1 Tax=Neptunomonas japonica TaxID=417574 RepID=UPI00042A7B99|nr:GGDEF domain-containing protein [Neptunomonas japonica]